MFVAFLQSDFASATEATDNVAWPLLKNRVLTLA